MKSPNAKMTFWIWTANSRVGDKHSTCVSRKVVSSDCKIAIENVAVFPVPKIQRKRLVSSTLQPFELHNVNELVFLPDWAWAITSRPFTMGKILLCWIADGFSNPENQRKTKCFGKIRSYLIWEPLKFVRLGTFTQTIYMCQPCWTEARLKTP